MPGISGVELAGELLKLRPDIPIVINSGYSELVNEEIAQAAGIVAYFSKPLDESLLLQKLDEILAAKAEPTDQNLSAENTI